MTETASTLEPEQRAAIVAAARSWISTPYHHQANVKGVGCDCGMLLIEVFAEAGMIERFDPRPYPPDWHLHRDEERYLGLVFERTHRIAAPKPGDIMVVRYGRAFAHGGIVTRTDPLTAVHAYQKYRRVVEEDLTMNPEIARRLPMAIFASFWA